jgi:alkylation response protein AidB-like acyl-CoA dehydrogenase
MLHVLSEDQKVIRDSIREFVETEVRPHVPEMERTHEFPRHLMTRCAEIGLTGILFPEEYGGSDLGLTTFCLALEEIARATQTLAITLDANMTLCFLPILQAGTQAQKDRYLPRAVSGELIGAYAMSEPSGATNFAAHTATGVRDGDEWVLNATKIFCTNSQAADVYLVLVRVDDNPSPTCFIVDKGTPGLSFGEIEKKLGWHGSNTGTVILDDVRVPASSMLGVLHQGLAAALIPIFESCVGIGAMCVGAAEGAFTKTLEHVKTRNIGGVNLITYQSVSDQIARMGLDIETSRALVYKTAAMIDAGGVPVPGSPLSILTSACKIQPPEMAARVCDAAIQLHGGYGYIDDMDVHRYWRDARACQIGEGPTSSHLAYIAAALTAQDVI